MILGILAGGGDFPVLAARKAKNKGARVVTVGIDGITSLELQSLSDRYLSVRFGELSRTLNFFKKEAVQGVILAGILDHAHALAGANSLKLAADPRVWKLILRMRERNATSLLGTLVNEIENAGMKVLPSFCYLEEELVKPGPMGVRSPSTDEMRDIRKGFRVAKELSRLDIGLTVCLSKGVVLAVEALEGTDACMRRAGEILKTRQKDPAELVMVKVARPNQDPRYDLPVAGPLTIKNAMEAGVHCIALEAGWTLLLERQEILQLANAHKIALFGVTAEQL